MEFLDSVGVFRIAGVKIRKFLIGEFCLRFGNGYKVRLCIVSAVLDRVNLIGQQAIIFPDEYPYPHIFSVNVLKRTAIKRSNKKIICKILAQSYIILAVIVKLCLGFDFRDHAAVKLVSILANIGKEIIHDRGFRKNSHTKHDRSSRGSPPEKDCSPAFAGHIFKVAYEQLAVGKIRTFFRKSPCRNFVEAIYGIGKLIHFLSQQFFKLLIFVIFLICHRSSPAFSCRIDIAFLYLDFTVVSGHFIIFAISLNRSSAQHLSITICLCLSLRCLRS